MKKHIKLLVVLGIILVGSFSFYLFKGYKKDALVYENNKIKPSSSGIAMMLETSAGSGNYEMTTRSEWPTEGYVFNANLSKCENGSELSWDNENKKVLMSGNKSDKCYVYFDVYVKPQVLLADYVKSLYTGTQGANSIYYHDASLTNGAGDNSYRYAGASDQVNNYVCFGSTTTPCPTDNLYRIIGVFGDKVKLIKYDYASSNLLGTDGDYYDTDIPDASYYKGSLTSIDLYHWNYESTNSETNTWSTSLLNKVNLNTNFITNIGKEWSNKIATTTWKVGGNTYANIVELPMGEVYQNEIVNPVTTNTTDGKTDYDAKIGLMYVSDYGYAASSTYWSCSGYNDDSTKDYRMATTSNWMYMGLLDWTISRGADQTNYVFGVNVDGSLYGPGASGYHLVRPAFYLESSITYVSGDGTQSSPIRIN